MSTAAEAVGVVQLHEAVPTVSLWKRVLRNPMALVPLVILAVIVVAGLLAQVIAPHDPTLTDIGNAVASPSGDHWLGTDSAGRDVLSRLLYGTQYSLAAALLALGIAAGVGVTTGLIAGYFGGWFDTVNSWIASLTMALPGVVVLLAASSVLGPSLWTAMAIFGFLLAPAFYRLVYVTVRGVRNELYVDAARVSGLGDARIIGRHILRVVRAPVIIQIGIVAAVAIAVQAGLSFIGFGDLEEATWGSMLVDGFDRMFSQQLLILWPALLLGITTLCLVLFANAVRDELEHAGPRAAPGEPPPPEVEAAPDEEYRHPAPNRTGTPLLTITNVSVGYPDGRGGHKPVVRDVSLTVDRGQVVGLVGESGSGKTQTAFAVLGLLPPTGKVLGGSIVFDGVELIGSGAKVLEELRGKRIAYVPQEPMSNLDPSFTIGSQLVEPMTVHLGMSKAVAKDKALALLARVGIPDPVRTFRSYPHEISGGMAQRVLIAGAVSCDPDLLIADEPTTALDVTVQAEVLDLLRELEQETHMAVLIVSHNFGVVADLCDHVAVMKDGRIVESGPVRAIFKDAQHPYTRSLLDAILEGGPARKPYDPPSPTDNALEKV
jgi:ABC-type dipeptide/oligopeptide/nickel transport system ATPase component/ABC-type dipeptide/oligopeptide/nickel transport system permease subunit